jgi:voltage-gated potassium channel
LAAAKLVLAYVLSKPAEAVDPDQLDVQEWQHYKDTPGMYAEMPHLGHFRLALSPYAREHNTYPLVLSARFPLPLGMVMSLRHRNLELAVQVLVFYSIATYFIEVEFVRSEHSTGFFLWSERIVASLFTVEYVVRWIAARSLAYPLRGEALIDLAAILPFYVGFFVDLRSLRLIRTLRILRLFKLHRHNTALQNLSNAFHRIRYEFAIIGFAVFIVVWCGAVAVFELEREAQPEVFGNMTDAVWFVLATVTTVGYGDKVPVTAGGKIAAACTMLAGLAIFGTFISLIGSALLDEIRKNLPPQLPAECPVTASTFEPEKVLAAIEAGLLQPSDAAGRQAVALLETACRRLLAVEQIASP